MSRGKEAANRSRRPATLPDDTVPQSGENENVDSDMAELISTNQQLVEINTRQGRELNAANIRISVLEQRMNELNREIIDLGAKATEINIAYQQLQRQVHNSN